MNRNISSVLVASLLLISGCGGTGSSPIIGGAKPTHPLYRRPATGFVHPQVPITWAVRTRAFQAPGSALSAAVTFHGAGQNGTDAGFFINRLASPASYTQTYSCPTLVKTGACVMYVRFHALSGATGGVTATAVVSVSIDNNGVLHKPDGSALGNVGSTSNLASVGIVPYQSATVGAATTMQVECTDLQGNVFPITAGSVTINLVAGSSAKVLPNQDVYGLVVGSVTLTATVDGIISPQAQIPVAAANFKNFRSVAQITNDMVLNPVSKTIWASVPSTGGVYGNDVIELNTATGAVLSHVFVGSEPDALGISDDGTTLYVGLDGQNAITTINTATHAVGKPFPIVPNPPGWVSQPVASGIEVQPGNSKTIAITTSDVRSTASTGAQVYDSGVPRPKALGAYEGVALAWVSPTVLFDYDNVDTGFTFYACNVNSTGVVPYNQSSSAFNGFGTLLRRYGNRVFGSDGTTVDAVGNVLGRFSGGGSDVAVNLATAHVLFVQTNFSSSSSAQINIYNMYTFVPLYSFVMQNLVGGQYGLDPTRLIHYGATGLAFRTPAAIYFIDVCPDI